MIGSFAAVAAVIAALVYFRRKQVQYYDRRAAELDDQQGYEVPPWDEGTEQIEPGVPRVK